VSKSPYFQVFKYGSECRRCNHDCKNNPDEPCPFFDLNESYKPERKQYSQRINWKAHENRTFVGELGCYIYPFATSTSINLGGSALSLAWVQPNVDTAT